MPKTKVRFTPIKMRGKASVEKKRIRDRRGNAVTLYTLDTESPTFATDLSSIFARNVVAARVANRGLSTTQLLRANSGNPEPASKRKSGKKKKPRKSAK